MRRKSVIAGLLLTAATLAGCGKTYVFPTVLPDSSVLSASYHTLYHDLSPLKDFRFFILMPRDWKTIDLRVEREPKPGEVLDVAGFRESGAWETNPESPVQGEVDVSVYRQKTGSGGTVPTNRQWLFQTLGKTVKNYTVLNQTGTDNAPDVLIRYGAGSGSLIVRTRLVPAADQKVFIVSGSAPEIHYPSIAQDLFVATATFRPDANAPAGSAVSSGKQ